MSLKIRAGFLVVMALCIGGCGGAPSVPNVPAAPAKPLAETSSPEKPLPSAMPAAAKAAPVADLPAAELKTWHFAELPPDQWQWNFTGGSKNQQSSGAVYTQNAQAEGWLNLRNAGIEADNVGSIRISCHWRDQEDAEKMSKEIPPREVTVFWARTSEMPPEGQWPYANERAVALNPDPANPYLFSGTLRGRKNWDGTIASIGIKIVFDPPESKPGAMGHTAVQMISLLK
ncbi:MAG TPA: hypothetical protein P5318_15025 [Candidatus Hydrogenedentes bacterium]|nr:hypothetical protein [Candidatus Hydrogenedentota bacterium]HPC17487.1 hypothetical protein [Candidatus Hydrogenedentota bacterium]HRT21429.1 hypothetical protein [Candidatus Hydrogenedentota bacterium]HRT66317.1 hypothetical protein [Candidatus Hydrogenedentota bacterium]